MVARRLLPLNRITGLELQYHSWAVLVRKPQVRRSASTQVFCLIMVFRIAEHAFRRALYLARRGTRPVIRRFVMRQSSRQNTSGDELVYRLNGI